MFINFNGQLIDQHQPIFNTNNSIISSGDAVAISLRILEGKIHLWEEYYFNLMAAARIMRMKIPLSFTPEFFQQQIQIVIDRNALQNAQLQFVCYRILDEQESLGYFIKSISSNVSWEYNDEPAEIDVYKDYMINESFFSLNNILHPEENIARIYAQENEFADLVLINHEKRMARSLYGSIFLIQGNQIKTPKNSEGVKKSVLRDYFINNLKKQKDFEVIETEIFPFEMQKADEIFVLQDGVGLQSFTQNRKKTFETTKAKKLLALLN